MKKIEEILRQLIEGKIYKIKVQTRYCEDWSKNSTGGDYSFWYNILSREDGKFEVEYCTSSDMNYCHYCGSFHHCSGGEGCGEEPQLYTLREVIELLKKNTFSISESELYKGKRFIFIDNTEVAAE
jgi:hypothetical protein